MQEAKLKEKIESMFNGEHVCPQWPFLPQNYLYLLNISPRRVLKGPLCLVVQSMIFWNWSLSLVAHVAVFVVWADQ
jgi:hypothetical protein